jgi:hypothetical protein
MVYFALNHEHIMQKYIYIIENDFQTGKSGSYRAVNLSSGSSPQTFEISLIALESHLFADYMAVQLFDILFAPSPRVLVPDPFFVRTKERTWTAGYETTETAYQACQLAFTTQRALMGTQENAPGLVNIIVTYKKIDCP